MKPRSSRVEGAACPSANVLGGVAGDSLLPEEREAVLEHLSRCDACRTIAARLATETEVSPESRTTRRVWAAAAVAAAVVAAACLALLRGEGGPADTEAALLAQCRALTETYPEVFTSFRPLSVEERRGGEAPTERGGLTPLLPAGRVLDRRPEFRWERAVVPTSSPTLVLHRADGTELWRAVADEDRAPYPSGQKPLVPGGRYVWQVSCQTVLGNESGARAFEVATDEERKAFVEARSAIEAEVAPRLAPLVLAHFAVRHELLGEAESAARAFLHEHPEDRVGQETLLHVLRRLGSSGANGPP